MTNRFFLSLSFLAALPFAVSSQADTVPGFGDVSFVKDVWWNSDFGLIAFGNEGRDVSWAFSASLGTGLATDGSAVYSRDYGRITPSGEPGWVMTEGFGWVHFATGDQDYGPWVWTERIGWIKHASTEIGTIFWIPQIQSWGQVQDDGSFYSFNFRKLTPTADPAVFISEIFGPVRIGEAKGWLRSETFGMIWANQDNPGNSFYLSAREEWVGVTGGGGIWSPVEQAFLERPGGAGGAPADFDIANVVWLQTDVSGWPVTSDLSEVSINGGQVCMTFDAGTRWAGFLGGTSYFNATPVVIVKMNGTYYASAFQWFRSGSNRHCKPISAIAPSSPPPISNWRPTTGETVGFMVTTPSRIGVPTRQFERTNIVWIEWP
ncbi:MAG: hypothetical protein ACLFSZ_00725 [Puniceicoccaceae bacterium]